MLNFREISKKVPNSATFRLNFLVRYKYWNAPSNLPLPYFNASPTDPVFSMSVLNGLEEYISKVTNSTTSCWCNSVWCNRVWQWKFSWNAAIEKQLRNHFRGYENISVPHKVEWKKMSNFFCLQNLNESIG